MRKWGRGLAPLVEQLDVEGCDLILEQAKRRAQIAKDAGHSGFLGNLHGEFFTMDQFVDEMERGTDTGKKFRRMYRRLYEEYMRKLV